MHFLRTLLLNAFPEVIYGFGTRDALAGRAAREDWRGKSMEEASGSFPLVSIRQVHGDGIIHVSGKALGTTWDTEGDALITRDTGHAIGVFTADCLPILLFDPARHVIGIVHAGWRGTAKGLVRKTAVTFQKIYGSRIEDMIAVLGPCIGPCCYNVDEPVRSSFADAGIPWAKVASLRQKGSWQLDLRRANLFLLEEAGLKRKRIGSLPECTSCNRARFYSYRAEGQTGRQLNFIALKPKET
jgi:polyphenol oxidase